MPRKKSSKQKASSESNAAVDGGTTMDSDWGSFELPLTTCSSGDEMTVIDLAVDSQLSARLRELGMVPGARIRLARAGQPLIIEIDETRFCLRGEEADGILVRVAEPVLAVTASSNVLEDADLA